MYRAVFGSNEGLEGYKKMFQEILMDMWKAAGGKIVVPDLPNGWFRVESLGKLRLSKPVKVHWFYQPAAVALAPGSFDERSSSEALSAAVGPSSPSRRAGTRSGSTLPPSASGLLASLPATRRSRTCRG